jgi:hypothetical protein
VSAGEGGWQSVGWCGEKEDEADEAADVGENTEKKCVHCSVDRAGSDAVKGWLPA